MPVVTTVGDCVVTVDVQGLACSVTVEAPDEVTTTFNRRAPPQQAVVPGVFAKVPYTENVAIVDDAASSDTDCTDTWAYVLVIEVDANAKEFTGAWVYDTEELETRVARCVPSTANRVLTTHRCGPFTLEEAHVLPGPPPGMARLVLDWKKKCASDLAAADLAAAVTTVHALSTTPDAGTFDVPGHAEQFKAAYTAAGEPTASHIMACANALYSGAPSAEGLRWWQCPQRIAAEIARLNALVATGPQNA